MNKRTTPPLAESFLLEMIRSFVVVAETLNVSHAMRLLGSTRQTIKRHIKLLEQHRGCALFRVDDKVYHLTEEGRKAIPAAHSLLTQAQNWATGALTDAPTLHRYSQWKSPTEYTYLEQKGLCDVFNSDTPFLKDCLLVWLQNGGRLEDLSILRPFAMVFRKDELGWIVVEAGEQSSSAEWFGAEWQKSCLGRRVQNLPASDWLSSISSTAFEAISLSQSARIDHICTLFPKQGHEGAMPISYKRLILSTYFPDGDSALLSIVERTHDLRISGLPDNLRTAMPPNLVHDIQI